MKETTLTQKIAIWITNVLSALTVCAIGYAANQFTEMKSEIAKLKEAVARIEISMKESDNKIRENAEKVHAELIGKCQSHETRITLLEARKMN